MKLLFLFLLLFASTTAFASYPESENLTLNAVPNQYVVGLKPDVSTQSFKFNFNEKVLKKYPVLNAVLVETTDDPSNLKRDGVLYVEANEMFRIMDTQTNPPWGLDRVDSRSGLDNTYKYSATGSGVHVYVIDTGIFSSQPEFSGRIGNGYSAVNGSTDDCNGHGTHVSGTILGTTYGIAKKATLHPVRVLDCQGSGTLDSILSGLEWVASNAKLPAVANMSLGGNKMQSINDATNKVIGRGVVVVVAAGNSSDDSCKYSPASTPDAITVAAMDRGDSHANFSSFGTCVDVYAPGVSILSAGINGNQSATMSGTSMASPHAAGVVALLLEKNPSNSPTQIAKMMINNATRSILSGVPSGTANLLIYSDVKDSGSPTPTPTPTPNPDTGIPSECSDSWGCFVVSGNLNPTTWYEQQPKDAYITVNYARPIKIYVKGNADFDIYLYHSADNGQNWTVVQKADSVGMNESLTYQANNRGIYTSIIMLKTSGTSGTYSAWIVK